MEDKYNQLQLERYSKELANVLCDRHFASHDTINGPQLIGFTPIKQVNLFVIKELLFKWHHEMANLRSPYFDYENAEVKEALVNFMNVLSRKISMKRNSFEPLLQKAIHDTFLLVLDPVTIFEEKFLRIQEEMALPRLKENLKYIDLDKPLFTRFIDTLSASGNDRDYILSRFRLFMKANEHSRTTLSSIIAPFNNLLPVSQEQLSGPTAPASTAFPTAPVVARPIPTPPAPVAEKEVVAPVHTAQREAPAPAPPRPVPQPAPAQEGSLNERFRTAERPTLNENFRKGEASSLADAHSNRKIESLKNSISINQRFSFINELFEGDNLTYYQAIKQLDEYHTPQEALQYVTHDLATKYDWSKKQEHVNKLLKLIERKFA